jgi:hypothetical protein
VRLPSLEVERPHADLSEVSRVELVEQDPVVVLTTGITTSSRVCPVLTDTSVTFDEESSEQKKR